MNDDLASFALVAESLRPDAGGPEAASRRRMRLDWSAPAAIANAHFVTPALYSSLRDAGSLADLPADARDYLALVHRSNLDRNAALRLQAVELVAALSAAGVRPLLLKGALSLFLRAHPDPATRMIRDLDLLVPHAAADTAVEVLHALGYGGIGPRPPGCRVYGDFARPADAGAVDLHFEILDAQYLLPAHEVVGRAKALRVGSGEALVPSPTDWVLHTLLHAQIHHLGNFYRGVIELRQLHEFATLARHYGDQIDWPFIARQMARHRLDAALQGYAVAANRLFGLPWPLKQRPAMMAALQYWSCLAQTRWPVLGSLGVPLGNVRSSFAWHRLRALYGDDFRASRPILRHAAQYFRKTSAGTALERLFRAR